MPASALRLLAGKARPPPAALLLPGAPGRPAVRAGPTETDVARPPPEEELVRLWHGQHLPADALVTRRGEPLRVVYRGRLSTGPGPDFRDAIIEGPGAQLWHGDIELHVRASGFRHHGHDRDPAYDSLVLHLVWEDDESEDTLLRCGRRVAVVVLANWFQRRREELARLLGRPDAWQEPCFGALARLGTEAVGLTLDRLGDLRFRQKAEAFRQALSAEDQDQVLYAAVLEALGYGGQREAFARLAEELPYRRLRAAAAGHTGGQAAVHLETALLAAAAVAASAAPGLWRLRGLRPANHPRRRLVGAARLLARAHQGLAAYARASLTDDLSPAAAIRAWMAGGGDDGSPALIGRSRAVELLVNGVLPFLAAGGTGADDALQGRALALFHRLPAPGSYGATAHLERALAPEGGRRLTGSARRQQGLLYLLRQYCRQGGCVGDCALSQSVP
jgi:hypothetical protein